MEVLLAQVWEGGLHTSDSQFSSSELSSQSLSPSQTQALLMQRAAKAGARRGQIRCRGNVILCLGSWLSQSWCPSTASPVPIPTEPRQAPVPSPGQRGQGAVVPPSPALT